MLHRKVKKVFHKCLKIKEKMLSHMYPKTDLGQQFSEERFEKIDTTKSKSKSRFQN